MFTTVLFTKLTHSAYAWTMQWQRPCFCTGSGHKNCFCQKKQSFLRESGLCKNRYNQEDSWPAISLITSQSTNQQSRNLLFISWSRPLLPEITSLVQTLPGACWRGPKGFEMAYNAWIGEGMHKNHDNLAQLTILQLFSGQIADEEQYFSRITHRLCPDYPATKSPYISHSLARFT